MTYPIIPLILAYGTTITYECDVRTLEQQKEPGLLQSRVSPGLNSVKMTISVNQLIRNGVVIEDFLKSRRGIYPFRFPPATAPPEIKGRLWTCKEYTINLASPASVKGCANGGVWQFSATLTQCFRGTNNPLDPITVAGTNPPIDPDQVPVPEESLDFDPQPKIYPNHQPVPIELLNFDKPKPSPTPSPTPTPTPSGNNYDFSNPNSSVYVAMV